MMIMMDDHNDDDNNDNNNNISDTFKGAFHTTIRQMKQMSLYFSLSVVNVGNWNSTFCNQRIKAIFKKKHPQQQLQIGQKYQARNTRNGMIMETVREKERERERERERELKERTEVRERHIQIYRERE